MIKLDVFPAEELNKTDELFITIAMELHATSVSSDKDRIQLSNLLEEAKRVIQSNCEKEEAKQLFDQIEKAKRDDVELVTYRGGLALYITKDDIYYYHLGIPVANLVTVAKSPNLAPLIENYQYTNQYHVLVLNGDNIRLFEGDATSVKELELVGDDAPKTLQDALGTELTNDSSYSGAYGSSGAGGESGGFHGHNEKSQEKNIDRENYFRAVDTYVDTYYSSPRDLPLVLYALPENQALFREISKNKRLVDIGIDESGAHADFNTVQEKSLAKNIEIVKKEQEKMFERFRETAPKFRIDNLVDDLAAIAAEGRIEELLINKNYKLQGEITDEGNFVESDNDFINDLISKVVAAKGQIYIVEEEDMPEDINLSARLRY